MKANTKDMVMANNAAHNMDAEMMEIMAADYMADHEDEMKGCELEGRPYLNSQTGHWIQDAHDENNRLFWLYAFGGRIYVGG